MNGQQIKSIWIKCLMFIWVVITMALVYSVYQRTFIKPEVKSRTVNNGQVVSEKIGTEPQYYQEFICTQKTYGIRLKFATYMKEVVSNYKVIVYYRGENIPVTEAIVKAEQIHDNETSNIYFSDPLEKGEYGYSIQAIEESEDTVVLYMSNKDEYPEGQLFYENQMVVGDFDMGFLIRSWSGIQFLLCWLFISLLILASIFNIRYKITDRICCIWIYIAMLGYLIYQMIYNLFNMNLGLFDEMAHVSYLAYLEQTHKWIPAFEEMTLLAPTDSGWSGMAGSPLFALSQTFGTFQGEFTDVVSYLGHAPFYYWLLMPLQAVNICEGVVSIDLMYLRIFNAFLCGVGTVICFYIGYTRINRKNVLLHLLYASLCIGLPFFSYQAVSINNDNLLRLSVPIFLLGFIRLVEKKYDIKTYVIIAVGMSLTVMTKLTMGLFVAMAFCTVIIFIVIRERSLKVVTNKFFVMSWILYVIPFAYYIYIYFQYGTFQPGLSDLVSLETFQTYTIFYKPYNLEISRSYIETFKSVFVKTFVRNWALRFDGKESSHLVIFLKMLMWLIPFISCVDTIDWKKKKIKAQSAYAWATFGVVLAHGVIAVRAYLNYGHGGSSSRYYITLLAFFALDIVRRIEKKLICVSNIENINRKTIQQCMINTIVIILIFGINYGAFALYFV